MALDGTSGRTTARPTTTRGAPVGDPAAGANRPTSEVPPGEGAPDGAVDTRGPAARPRAAATPSRTAGLSQPTVRSATQPEVAGPAPEGAVDPANPSGQPAPPSTWLSRTGESLENLGAPLESDKARLVSTAVDLGAAACIPVVGNVIAIARGALHLLGFLGSCFKGHPSFTHLFQGLTEVALGSLFIAPMAAPAGMLIGEMGIPHLMGGDQRNFGNRPPASAGQTRS